MTSGITYFPQVVPQNSVVGRLSSTAGITEAIPFAQLAAALGVGGSTYLLTTGISGTNTIVGSTATAPPLGANQIVFFIPANTNTGPATFNRDALGAINIFCNGAALGGGEIQAAMPLMLFYDGTVYNIIEEQAWSDAQPIVVNAADITKKLKFLLSGLSPGTTRTLTIPDANITLANWSTGDVKLTLKTVADAGWVLMNDTSIGDASSGATGRANADTAALFTLLWNNTVDADCAVSTGRGANAAADYAAHKTIALPKALGRALATYGAGSGLTSRALAHVVGEETHLLTPGETPVLAATDHVHQETFSSGIAPATAATIATSSGAGGNTIIAGNPGAAGNLIALNTLGASSTVVNVGGGASHNIMQPTLFLNVMVKL